MRGLFTGLALVLLVPLQAQANLIFGDCFEYGCDNNGNDYCAPDAAFYADIVGGEYPYFYVAEDPTGLRHKFCSHQSGETRGDVCTVNTSCTTGDPPVCLDNTDCSFGSTCEGINNDGVCTATVCTAGRVGNGCAINSNCNTGFCHGMCVEEHDNDYALVVADSDDYAPTLIEFNQGTYSGCILRLERVAGGVGVGEHDGVPLNGNARCDDPEISCIDNNDCGTLSPCVGSLCKNCPTHLGSTCKTEDGLCHDLDDDRYKLAMYWDDPDTFKCTSALNNATVCTPATKDEVCDEAQPGEASCALARLGQTQDYFEGDTIQIVMCQDNTVGGLGEAECRLTEGGFSRAGRIEKQGACSGSEAQCPTTLGDACGGSGDCDASPGGCVCVSTGLFVGVSKVRFGDVPTRYMEVGSRYLNTSGSEEEEICLGMVLHVISTGTGTASADWNYVIDSIAVGDSANDEAALSTFACQDLVPDDKISLVNAFTCQDGSNEGENCLDDGDCSGGTCVGPTAMQNQTGCSASLHEECLDEINDENDGPGHDEQTSEIFSNSNADALAENFSFTNLPAQAGNDRYMRDSYCTVLGYDSLTTCANNDDCSGGSNLCIDQAPIIGMVGVVVGGDDSGLTGDNQRISTAVYEQNLYIDRSGNVDDVDPWVPVTASVVPGGIFYRKRTSANSAQMKIQVDSEGGTGSQTGYSAALLQVFHRMVLPTSPNVAVDINGDGELRLVITGDSQFNDMAPFVANNFFDYDSVMACTVGATTSWDVATDIEDIADGKLNGRMNCRIMRGSAGNADLVIVSAGGNDIHATAQPIFDKNYPYGKCRGGANNEQAAVCHRHSGYKTGINSTTYCLNYSNGSPGSDDNWLEPDTNITVEECRACTTNAECVTNTATCTDNSDCDGTRGICESGDCSVVCGHCERANGTPDNHLSLSCNVNADCDYEGTCTDSYCTAGTIGEVCVIDNDCDAKEPEFDCVRECHNSSGSGNSYFYDVPKAWMAHGCIEEPSCPDGIAYGLLSTATTEAAYIRIIDHIQSRTGAKEAEVLFVTQALDESDCEGSTFFTRHKNRIHLNNKIAMNRFEAAGEHWIDFARRIDTRCPGGRAECFRSEAHYTGPGLQPSGNCASGEAGLTLFLEALRDFLETTDTSDGVCNGGTYVCDEGAEGDGCATNADCDTFRRAP